jgi:hypothetical protein
VDRRDSKLPRSVSSNNDPQAGTRSAVRSVTSLANTIYPSRTRSCARHSRTTRTRSGGLSQTRLAPVLRQQLAGNEQLSCLARAYSNQCPLQGLRHLSLGRPPSTPRSFSSQLAGRAAFDRSKEATLIGPRSHNWNRLRPCRTSLPRSTHQ